MTIQGQRGQRALIGAKRKERRLLAWSAVEQRVGRSHSVYIGEIRLGRWRPGTPRRQSSTPLLRQVSVELSFKIPDQLPWGSKRRSEAESKRKSSVARSDWTISSPPPYSRLPVSTGKLRPGRLSAASESLGCLVTTGGLNKRPINFVNCA